MYMYVYASLDYIVHSRSVVTEVDSGTNVSLDCKFFYVFVCSAYIRSISHGIFIHEVRQLLKFLVVSDFKA